MVENSRVEERSREPVSEWNMNSSETDFSSTSLDIEHREFSEGFKEMRQNSIKHVCGRPAFRTRREST
jgi:hypothetical protein